MPDQTSAPVDVRAARRLQPYALVLLLGISAFPFVGFAYENRNEPLSITRLAVYALVVWLLAVGALWLLLTWRRALDPDRAAIAVGAGVFSFFASSWWIKPDAVPGEPLVPLVLWLVVTVGLAVLIYRISRADAVRTFLLFAAVLLPLVPLAGLVLDAVQSRPSTTPGSAADPVALDLPADAPRPNIYHFVLDFHGRNDQIEQLTGYDNRAFLDGLAERGFAVAERAVSSYPITALSVSSTLDMGYVATEPAHVAGGLDPYFDMVRGDNRVVEQLRDAGYTFVYSPNGTFNGFDCSAELADGCIEPTTIGLPVSELDYQLIESTPLGLLDLAQTPFTDPTYVVDELAELDPRPPFFLLAHVISPHPPYRFEDDCTRRDEPRVRKQSEPERERRDYATDVRCVDEDMLAAIDEIEAVDPTAVIVVQSDHGSEFLTPWFVPYEDWSDEALAERYSVLNAVRLPEGCDLEVDDDEALVNTYRLLFACLNGDTDVDRLPFEAYLFRWGDEDDLVPIEPDRLTGAG